MKKQVLFLFFLCLAFQLQAQKVLFIGNSLTYTNDLPTILEEIAQHFNQQLVTESVYKPNYAIIDHLNDGQVQQKIATHKYDYVIIQQGPSSQEAGREMLLNDGKKIAEICSKYNSKLGYFMVWPSKKYYFTFDKVIANHTHAAKVNSALLFPVGIFWKEYEKLNNKISLYDSDQFHPSKTGSFLAALTIYYTLYPTADLYLLTFKDSKKWVSNKKTLETIISILKNGNH